jgi:oxalate decarboxylase/phosphoglucose isomerase-like protein (cupin superfamily)
MNNPDPDNIAVDSFPVFAEPRGSLGVVEFESLPFVPKRFFWLFGVGPGFARASHAHKLCEQFLVVQNGSITAKVTNSEGRVFEFNLTAGQSIYLRPRLWLELENFSPDAVVGVMASHAYESSDYINSIEDL